MFATLKSWLSGMPALPEGWAEKFLQDTPLLAVDLELTSLDVAEAKVTSIGWVEGCNNSINIERCGYHVIRASGDLAQSPVIHGLTEEELTAGMHIRDVLKQLVPFAETHLWLCHNAALDLGILKRILNDTNIACPPIVFLDTLKIAVYQLKKHHEVLPSNSANLSVCRQRMGLPAVPAHNALDDAMATMQLWFAQNQALNRSKNVTIGDLMHTQAVSCKKIEKS